MFRSNQKKVLFSICAILLLSAGILGIRIFSPAYSLADRSPCAVNGATPIQGSGQAIGTFLCITPTPTPTPSPIPKPLPTRSPQARTVPQIQYQAPQIPGNPDPPVLPFDKNAQDPNCPPGEAHGLTKTGMGGGMLTGVQTPGNNTPPAGDFLEPCAPVPMLYLYPPTLTRVSVTVQTPGYIYNSNPTYPVNGWHDILANPDGILLYHQRTYHSLMYEFKVPLFKSSALDHGIVLTKQTMRSVLVHTLLRYGLSERETNAFLEEWIPRLTSIHTDAVYFSLYDRPTKNLFDSITIFPIPDTTIYAFAYFRPVNRDYVPKYPLSLPAIPPERKGFTAVEWGALIDASE